MAKLTQRPGTERGWAIRADVYELWMMARASVLLSRAEAAKAPMAQNALRESACLTTVVS